MAIRFTHDCYNKALKLAEKKSQHLLGHDMEILTVEDNERARKDNGPNPQGGSLCNMISIEELPEEYEEEKVVYAEPVPGALMMVPSQPKEIF